MENRDIATQDYVFQFMSPSQGELTCRHCSKKIIVAFKMKNYLILASSKVNISEKWCQCTSLRTIIQSLIHEILEQNTQD